MLEGKIHKFKANATAFTTGLLKLNWGGKMHEGQKCIILVSLSTIIPIQF